MTSSDILLRDLSDDGILRLTLNDPKRRNALSERHCQTNLTGKRLILNSG